MGGIGQKLVLLVPGPFHRTGGPVGQQNGHPQQQEKRRRGDEHIGPDHLPQHCPLHGHVHKRQFLIEAVVHPEKAEVILGDDALTLLHMEADGDNLLQCLGVLDLRVGAAGDLGGVSPVGARPHIDGEIGQENAVFIQSWPEKIRAVLPDHLGQHLMADKGGVLPDGREGGQENGGQHDAHQRHANRHKFQTQFFNQNTVPPKLLKTLWKTLKTLWKLWKTLKNSYMLGQKSHGFQPFSENSAGFPRFPIVYFFSTSSGSSKQYPIIRMVRIFTREWRCSSFFRRKDT